ncbi:MAG TPA: DUF4124 domain-containing protein [Burkholderiales bacterium]|nr:DUF4124 domain-containing protein [Burkholderiales bacterium]
MTNLRTLALLLGAACIATPAIAQKLYKYTDPATGRTIYTDKVPAEQAGKANEQLSGQGMVVKRNEAAPTAEQIAAREAQRKRKLEEDIAAKEEKRKNQALLNTYPSEKEIDEARERALKANEDAVKDAERKLADAQKRKKALAGESEFYAKRPMPAQLKQDIQLNEVEQKALAELVEKKKQEIDAINARYDEDLRRYREVIKAGAVATK